VELVAKVKLHELGASTS